MFFVPDSSLARNLVSGGISTSVSFVSFCFPAQLVCFRLLCSLLVPSRGTDSRAPCALSWHTRPHSTLLDAYAAQAEKTRSYCALSVPKEDEQRYVDV